MNIAISRVLLDQILAHAAQSPEEEACGLLFGAGGKILFVRSVENVARDRRSFFELDPAALLAAHREARSGGAAIIGHYHSHPSGDLLPSKRDAECAAPGLLWLIVHGRDAAIFEARHVGPIQGRFHALGLELY